MKEVLSMNEMKEKMCNFLIKRFGFEDPEVIWFCQVVEDVRFDDFMTRYAYFKVLNSKGVLNYGWEA
jgi:hypothetical protein